jgi:4-diphosphocytidyl-2-C-methyl-D-erythritol kinase
MLSMDVHRVAASTIVRAPAKLNLFFEVLAKRSDGYHEIETLMVPISLCDTLIASSESTGRVRLACHWALPPSQSCDALSELPPEPQNLVTRAVELLRTRAGVAYGVSLQLIKRIPTAAGLGGGSSDAAAALLAVNALWDLGWSHTALAQLGGELGSDVPFFFAHGPAACRGRGEQVETVAGLGDLHFVLVRPPEGLATAKVYANCRVPQRPCAMAPLIGALRRGDTRRLRQQIHNRLEEAATPLSPWIARLRREFAAQDCLAAQMSGSGSSYFGICRHARHARRVAQRLQARGLGRVYAVSTSS